MECIKNELRSTMDVVDDVALELRYLSGLCDLMAQTREPQGTVAAESVSDTMYLLRNILDAQVKVLDAIQWPKKQEASA